MARMKRKQPATKAVPKTRAKSRRVSTARKKSGPKQSRKPASTVKIAAKRALLSAGRAAKAVAREGTRRAANAGRRALARGARSVAGGVQHVAVGLGDTTASALESIADHVTPADQE